MCTKEMQLKEARARLEILCEKGLMVDVLRDFDSGRIHYSDRSFDPLLCTLAGNKNGVGGLFWVDQPNTPIEIRDALHEFEQENDAVVFHATHEYTEFGELLDVFYVSKYEEEWEMDRRDLENGFPFVRSINLSEPMFTEFGHIGIQASGGGLIRIS